MDADTRSAASAGWLDPLRGGLDLPQLAADPLDQFAAWMADVVAAGLPEPTAMVLATASASGRPRARTVLLKHYDHEGYVFYTNRTSRKGTDMAQVPRACLLFGWHAIGRQVIIEGAVAPLTTADSEPYFHSRPRASQLSAWASRQSSVVASRAELEDGFARRAAQWPEGTQIPVPDFWGGYRVAPEAYEFWRDGSPGRMHDRFRYRRDGGGWVIERLAP